MEGRQQPPPFGALMFSCNGRGQNLYREENYDSRTLAAFVPVPFSGMFCNGDLFPSLHGHYNDDSQSCSHCGSAPANFTLQGPVAHEALPARLCGVCWHLWR